MSLPSLRPRLTVSRVNKLLKAQYISVEDLVTYCHSLARAGEEVWKLNAYERLVPLDDLLAQARDVDTRRNKSDELSCLDGIPIAVKANMAVASLPLTAGSRILGAGNSDAPPVGYNATVVNSLLDNGAVVIGSTTLDEFGMGSLGSNVINENGRPSACRNPQDFLRHCPQDALMSDQDVIDAIRQTPDEILERHGAVIKLVSETTPRLSAGGSSCGSAAAVAHGSALIALGSDTGGSVRLPAAWCGVTGFKPTYGALSRHGLVSYASSLDTIGFIAPTVVCILQTWPIISRCAGMTRDSTFQESDTAISQRSGSEGLKIAIPSAFSVEEMDPLVCEAWAVGASSLMDQDICVEVVDSIDVDLVKAAMPCYYTLAVAEASSNLARYDGFRYGIEESNPGHDNDIITILEQQFARSRSVGFGDEVIRRTLCGTSVLSSENFKSFYEAALGIRRELEMQMEHVLTDYDAILLPVSAYQPQNMQETVSSTTALSNDVMTVPFSLVGLPAMSLPFGSSSLQLVGRKGNETDLIRIAQFLEND